MASKLILKKENTILSSYEIADDFCSVYKENTTNFEFDFFLGEEKVISFDGVRIYFGKSKIDNSLVFESKSNFPFLSVSFEFGGESSYVPKENCTKSISMSIKKNSYNVFYMPEIDGVSTVKGVFRDYFIVLFTQDYIEDLFKNNFSDCSHDFEKALRTKTPFSLFKESLPIPFKLIELINEIRRCYYKNNIKEVYIESKIMEMFALIFSEQVHEKELKRLTKKDLIILQESEEYIRNNISEQTTLEQLAFEIGTNQKKLKDVFNFVYNETVFEFSSRLRMEKAKELLMADTTISEVAYLIGYKNPQHFSTAFKRRFGYLPSAFKRDFQYVCN